MPRPWALSLPPFQGESPRSAYCCPAAKRNFKKREQETFPRLGFGPLSQSIPSLPGFVLLSSTRARRTGEICRQNRLRRASRRVASEAVDLTWPHNLEVRHLQGLELANELSLKTNLQVDGNHSHRTAEFADLRRPADAASGAWIFSPGLSWIPETWPRQRRHEGLVSGEELPRWPRSVRCPIRLPRPRSRPR